MTRQPVRVLGYLLTAASFVYIAWAIYKLDLHSIRVSHPFSLLFWVPIFSLFYAVLFTVFPVGYAKILGFISGKKVPFLLCYPFFMKSHIMKYLPGNVMEFVGRNILGKKLGLEHKHLALASVLEAGFLLVASVFLTLTFPWPNAIPVRLPRVRLFYVLAALLLILLSTVIFWIKKRSAYSDYSRYWSWRFVWLSGTVVLLHAVALAGLGLILGLIYKYVLKADIGWMDMRRICSALTLSWSIGFITPGASGGIGVKEALLLMTLSPIYGRELTLIAAVIHRVVSIIGDILTYVMGLVVEKYGPNQA